ncbi:MAG: histidine phosphatase family protein [Burkholderiaceae bacterium]
MTVTLALLRHAETPWSRDKQVQGRTDIGLTEQARAGLSRLAVPDPCAAMPVFSSPLQRCTQTAAQLGLVPTVEPRLIEMAWGRWEGRRLVDLRAELGEAMAENEARGWDFMAPDGESPRQVWQRVRPWLRERALAGASTLAITHRGVMRVVFAQATGWDMLGKPPARLDWNALQLFTLDAHGMPQVQRLNLPLDALADPGLRP